jgi:uncharacterized protein YegP (UPF0339 family)
MTAANQTGPAYPSRSREPAEAHFRRPGETPAKSAILPPEAFGTSPSRFEIYRTDEVRMTSLRFAGGDWHWRLCDEAGKVLVDAGGYRSERACRKAVTILQKRAASATL